MSSYFLLMDPEEAGVTYNSENKTVEYELTLVELKNRSEEPCTVLEWFHGLYTDPNPADYEKSTLGKECDGLSNTYMKDEDDDDVDDTIPPKIDIISNWDSFGEWIQSHLLVERHVNVSPRAIVVGQTREFDVEYAFFHANALASGELDPLLSQWLDVAADGKLTLTHSKVIFSAYL